jgi:hypothetical protein
MLEPLALRPGTRMPTYWSDGVSSLTDVLDGEADAQIDAIRTYLSLGEALPLPPGVLVDRADYLVVPAERPACVSAFWDGLSARVLAVGFPERVHLAFDLDGVRLALVWRGAFLDATGTWRGRAGQLAQPAGEDVIELPPGPALAWLAAPDAAWPEVGGKPAGWRMRGQVRDAGGRPSFRYRGRRAPDDPAGEVRVEEALRPVLAAGGAVLVRSFAFESTEPAACDGLLLRAAFARRIEADVGADEDAAGDAEGAAAGFRTSDGLYLRVSGAATRVRHGPLGDELLVDVASAARTPDGQRALAVELVW